MRILLIGHARHGKDTVAEMLRELFDYKFESSSEAAARIFIYDKLKEKYGYQSLYECFVDRMKRREEWFNLICEYNEPDKTRLAREILKTNDIYVGMRNIEELQACIEDGIFDMVIGVYCPTKPLEPEESFNIDIWKFSDIIIPNGGTLFELKEKLKLLSPILKKE